MAHSLRCGLAALASLATAAGGADKETAAPTAALVMLGDTPYITIDDLRRLIDAWIAAPDRPAAAAYDGTVGAPCILPRAAWPEVMALEGDRGAGAWLRSRGAKGVAIVEVAIAAATCDIDVSR